MSRLLVGAAVLSGALAGGAWFLYPHAAQVVARNGAPVSSDKAARAPASTSPISATEIRFQPQAGQAYSYAFDRKIRIAGLQPQPTEIAYRGTLSISVTKTDLTGFEAVASTELRDQPKLAPAPVRLRFDSRSQTLALFSNPGNDPQLVDVTKDLLAIWLFPMRSDTVGHYQARVETLPDARFRKTKLTYVDVASAPEIISSSHLLTWDPALAVPREIDGSETTKMAQGSFSISADSSYALRLSAPPRPTTSDSNSVALDTPEELRVVGHSTVRVPQWSELADRLERADSLTRSERLQLFGDLAKSLKASGSAPSDLIALLRSSGALALGTKSEIFKTTVGALATAGTPASQSALIGIYQDPDCPTSGKGTILTSFTTTQAPLVPTTQQFLAAELSQSADANVAYGAGYALGAAQRTAPDPSSLQTLQNTWANAATTPDQLAALDAIGNSGNPTFFSDLSSVIASTDPAVLRAKAVFALRFMPGDATSQLLAASLNDAESQVRVAAAQALKYRDQN